MNKLWAIHIDIEGFSNIYLKNNALAYHLLCNLIRDVYYIMVRVFPEPDRTFDKASLSLITYHFGDGVMIIPGPIGVDLDIAKPLSISIALMKATTWRGGFAKTAISFGEMSDYQGCFPSDIRDKIIEASYIETHTGLLTILPVMGEGWINAYKLSKKDSGPILLLDKAFQNSVDDTKFYLVPCGDEYINVDWINSRNELITHILERIEVPEISPESIKSYLRSYLETEDSLSDRCKWKLNAKKLIERTVN